MDGTNATNTNDENYEPRIHDNWLKTYLQYTNATESPESFHLWRGLSIIASALDRNVYIKRGYGNLYPNLYIVLVSPTGRSKKTMCSNIGTKFLYRVDGIRILADKATPEGLVEYLALAPIRKHKDTREQLCTALIYAPELSTFFSNQSYNSGLIELLTALYDSPDIFEYTPKHALVKNKQGIRLNNVNLNFFGASNPEWLAKGFQEDSFGGGFMGRTIFIYSTITRRSENSAWMELDAEAEVLEITLLKDLQKMAKLRGAFKTTKEAHSFYKDYYINYKGNFSGRMGGYYERKPTHLLKIAMLLSVNFDDSLVITMQHLQAALKLLDAVEAEMPEAFAYISATNEARISQHILESMQENSGYGFRKVLFSQVRHLLKNTREFDDIMGSLEEADIVRRAQIKDTVGYVLTALIKTTNTNTNTNANIENKNSGEVA